LVVSEAGQIKRTGDRSSMLDFRDVDIAHVINADHAESCSLSDVEL
jgi:hypothetical protein